MSIIFKEIIIENKICLGCKKALVVFSILIAVLIIVIIVKIAISDTCENNEIKDRRDELRKINKNN